MIEKLNTSRPSLKIDHTSAIADHVKTTGHNIKWDHFDILASGKTDYHCKIKETLLIQELKPVRSLLKMYVDQHTKRQVYIKMRRKSL